MSIFSLNVTLSTQNMQVLEKERVIKQYPISTGKNGAGELIGSEKTPRGWHVIRAKIGALQPMNAIFVKRRFTGEIYYPELKKQFPERDWILTRIFWLSGLEVGKNRLGKVDTMRRYVYIHGAPDEAAMGTPESRGCIRMHNHNLIELFNIIPVGTRVLIQE